MSTKFLPVTFCLLALVAVAKAAPIETDSSVISPGNPNDVHTPSDPAFEATYDGLVSPVLPGDILLGATISSSVTTTDVGFPLSGLNDGQTSNFDGSNGATTVGASSHDSFFGDGDLGTTLASNPTVTFTLNTSVNTNGYTLSSFNSIYGWLDTPAFSDQDYTLSYSTVSAPTTFITLASVRYDPFAPNATANGGGGGSTASLVTLTGLDVSNVGAVQVQFSPVIDGGVPQRGQVIRELELFGTPTSVPEPSTYALMGLGLLALVAIRRVRQIV